MDKCLFCRIRDRKIPSLCIYEDKMVYAFLDINPVNEGHTLVIPKVHAADFLSIVPSELPGLIWGVQKVATAVQKGTGADGFNLIVNNFRAAGQLVDHVHIHIIPRFNWDGFQHWPGKPYEDGQADKVKEKIRTFLK